MQRLGRWRWIVRAAIVLGLLFGIASARLFIWPSGIAIEDVEPADAVVMFAGGTGERLDAVLRLMDQGVADTLVLPNGTVPGWIRGNRLCAGEHASRSAEPGSPAFSVLCPEPDPDSTRGEAQLFAELATENEWSSLIAVTSSYHVVRADLRLQRCFNGEVQRVPAGQNRSRAALVSLVIHEWLGLAQATVSQRSC